MPGGRTRVVGGFVDESNYVTAVDCIVGNHDEILRGWLDQGFPLGSILTDAFSEAPHEAIANAWDQAPASGNC